MTDLWLGIVIGALLSVPIGIAVNLVTPRIARVLERQSASLKGQNRKRARRRYLYVRGLVEDPLLLQTTLYRETMLTLGVLVVSVSLFVMGGLLLPEMGVASVVGLGAITSAAVILTIGSSFLLSSVRLSRNVGNFIGYKSQLVERFGEDIIAPEVDGT